MHLEPAHLRKVQQLLNEHLPECLVFAFGSRATGKNLKAFSDLDLVVVDAQPLPSRRMALLRLAFEDSDLPFRVDVLDWARLAPSFRARIEEGWVPITKQQKIE
jgi:predicted nucleotidyltransferase